MLGQSSQEYNEILNLPVRKTTQISPILGGESNLPLWAIRGTLPFIHPMLGQRQHFSNMEKKLRPKMLLIISSPKGNMFDIF